MLIFFYKESFVGYAVFIVLFNSKCKYVNITYFFS